MSRVSIIPRLIDSKWLDDEIYVTRRTRKPGRKTAKFESSVSTMQIANAVKKAIIWFFVMLEAKRPIAEKAAIKNKEPRYPPIIGPGSGEPNTKQVII